MRIFQKEPGSGACRREGLSCSSRRINEKLSSLGVPFQRAPDDGSLHLLNRYRLPSLVLKQPLSVPAPNEYPRWQVLCSYLSRILCDLKYSFSMV